MRSPLPRNLGKFYISDRVFQSEGWENMQKYLSHFLIVRCEFLFCSQCFEYIAYSNLFDEIKEGEEPPEYDLDFKSTKDKIIVKRHETTNATE